MVGKYQGRGDKPGHRYSATGRFLTSVTDTRWVLPQHGRIWRPPTDVYETDDSIVVKVEVAGMSEDDFTITYSDQYLIIAGIRRDPAAKLGYHQMEIPYGEFRTDAYVSKAVDADGIEASYEDGFLLVTLPKAGPHRIPVESE
jgi:HSP20 family molecular chaperone IbpA